MHGFEAQIKDQHFQQQKTSQNHSPPPPICDEYGRYIFNKIPSDKHKLLFGLICIVEHLQDSL